MSLRIVLLPQPEGPSRTRNSPAGTVRSMPARAVTAPYRFVSATSSIEWGLAGCGHRVAHCLRAPASEPAMK